MLEILKVDNNSVASDLELQKGDFLVAYNGEDFVDILDYFFLESQEQFTLTVKRKDELFECEIEKDEDEDIGLTFVEEIKTRTCHNKCVFCFVDQMAKGMRETLYCKDDDYRLSFISGNYITLTNDTEKDIDRIIKLKLSPIYVSVHATEPKLREKLLCNRFSGNIMQQLQKLTENGIAVHTQIVLCDGLNDKEMLEKSMIDLFSFYPMVKSLAVVPVGLTKYREGLFPLKPATKEFAEDALNRVEAFQKKCYDKTGDCFVRCSDEFYCLTERELPSDESYDDYSQIENGVGLIRKFQTEFYEEVKLSKIKFNKQKTLLVTGESFYPYFKKMLDDISCPHKLMAIENKFFGKSVTVSGLLTGQDIIDAVKNEEFSRMIIPRNVLKEFGKEFLDNITLEDMEKTLSAEILVSENDGAKIIELL